MDRSPMVMTTSHIVMRGIITIKMTRFPASSSSRMLQQKHPTTDATIPHIEAKTNDNSHSPNSLIIMVVSRTTTIIIIACRTSPTTSPI